MTKLQAKPIPDGMHSVTPHLICAGAAAAIEFYKKAFNAVEISRLPGADGKLMHASNMRPEEMQQAMHKMGG
jgi:PhnB protein